MSKQLHEIIPQFSKMSEEEKLEVVKRIRYNKYVARPSLQKRKKKATASKKKRADTKVVNAIKGLSPEQLAKILKELGQ